MIEIEKVTKSYGETVVVDDISITLPSGGVTSIIGPNGAGKSTLLSMIGRLLSPDAGSIQVDGLDVSKTPSDVLARRLSLLRQDNHMAARLTVRDLVTFGRYPYSKGRYTVEDERHVGDALRFLGLEACADRFLDELSGGQRQRAFVAMVMCQNTDYVLLDEPLNNLDIKHAVEIMRLVRRAADEFRKTVIVVLHDINMASAYSDHIIAMKNGRIVAHGAMQEVIQQDLLSEIYETQIAVESLNGRRIAVY
ncbi:iron complex transport system ATP-binding protein [Mesorhizobium sp. J18]|uniref:iron ABC transporter ATP-binding protein n=1 Tax=Mesorhizobium sp. J18 TaxID=935263 RepID=UPI00119BBD8A|nr:ABC transporter ATP-binding protein [Mesorhizobium sp. J18]TWG92362.1 iron complex transport system ATP-binding protein [Mesorhizobium sp. J18]